MDISPVAIFANELIVLATGLVYLTSLNDKLKKIQLHSDCFHSPKTRVEDDLTTVHQHPGLRNEVCYGQRRYGQIGKAEVALL